MCDDKQKAEIEHLRAEADLFKKKMGSITAPFWTKPFFWTVLTTIIAAIIGVATTINSASEKALQELRKESIENHQQLTRELLTEMSRNSDRLKQIFRENLFSRKTCKYIELKISESDCKSFQEKYAIVFGFVVAQTLKEREGEVDKIVRIIKLKALPRVSEVAVTNDD